MSWQVARMPLERAAAHMQQGRVGPCRPLLTLTWGLWVLRAEARLPDCQQK